jgi:hypothetical protein
VVRHQEQQTQVWVATVLILFLAVSHLLAVVAETVLTTLVRTAVQVAVAVVLQHPTRLEELESLEKETLVEQEKQTKVAVDLTDLLVVVVVLAQ